MIRKLLKYAFVRAWTAPLYFIGLIGFTEFVGLPYWLSAFCAFAPSFLLEFYINHRWTFQKPGVLDEAQGSPVVLHDKHPLHNGRES